MPRVETYVFLDLETSDLPSNDGNTSRITEISLVAVKRDHIIDIPFGETPRVQHKLTLCLYPRKFISIGATEVTKLSNDLLEKEPTFNSETFKIIDTFFSVFTQPVCLVAHNGHTFDFPILKNHLEKLNVRFTADLLCADSLYSIYDMDMAKSNLDTVPKALNVEEKDELDFHDSSISMRTINEVTPKRRKIQHTEPNKKVVRKLFYGSSEKPKVTYKLTDVYRRVLKRHPQGQAHRAENDCIMLLEICSAYGQLFVDYIDRNSSSFSEVKPMTIAVKLGY